MFPGLDLSYTDPAQQLITAGVVSRLSTPIVMGPVCERFGECGVAQSALVRTGTELFGVPPTFYDTLCRASSVPEPARLF